MEFRYYQMSAGSPILALLGQKWVQNYGENDVIIFIFIIILRSGTAMEARDNDIREEEERFMEASLR